LEIDLGEMISMGRFRIFSPNRFQSRLIDDYIRRFSAAKTRGLIDEIPAPRMSGDLDIPDPFFLAAFPGFGRHHTFPGRVVIDPGRSCAVMTFQAAQMEDSLPEGQRINLVIGIVFENIVIEGHLFAVIANYDIGDLPTRIVERMKMAET
jgi:hypothetical protein